LATYRLLADHYVGQQLLEAGSVVSDGPGGVLPPSWIPTLACDPLDVDATNKFFAAGPTLAMFSAEHGSLSVALNGNRWSGKPVAGPGIYWEAVTMTFTGPGGGQYPVQGFQLHGAAGLGFKSGPTGPVITSGMGVGFGAALALALDKVERLDGVSSISRVPVAVAEPALPQPQAPVEWVGVGPAVPEIPVGKAMPFDIPR